MPVYVKVMEANRNKSVTFKTPSSNDLQYIQSSVVPEFSSGHMAYTGSYGELSQTLASSTPANTPGQPLGWSLLPNSSLGSEDNILSGGTLSEKSVGSIDSKISLELHNPESFSLASPSLKQQETGFNSSMLLPESVNTHLRYQPVSSFDNTLQLHQVTIPNLTLSQSNEPQDSGIHMTALTDAHTLPFVAEQEHALNQTANTTYNNQSLQLIQTQLQQQLNQVQLQLQKLNFLQQQHSLSQDQTHILSQERLCTSGSISQLAAPIRYVTPGQATDIPHYFVQPTQHTQSYTSAQQPAFVQQLPGRISQLRGAYYNLPQVTADQAYSNRLKAPVSTEQQQMFIQQQCVTPSTTRCQYGAIQPPFITHSSAAVPKLQQAHQESHRNTQPVNMQVPVANERANTLQETAIITSAGTQQPSTQHTVLPTHSNSTFVPQLDIAAVISESIQWPTIQHTVLPSYSSTALPPQMDNSTVMAESIQPPTIQHTVLPSYSSTALPLQMDNSTVMAASIQRPTIQHTVLPSYSGTAVPPQMDNSTTMATSIQQPSTQEPNALYTQTKNVSTAVPTINMSGSAQEGSPIDPSSCTQNSTSYSKKHVYPDNFDGSGKTEWSDYIVHFEQCANWNQWSDLQKAQMLSIHLRGEAQRLLSGLTVAQLTNYHAMKQIITDRYEPKEKDVAYRCQFRYRKRDKGESASDYGYHLNRLAQKAYPNLTLNQLEVHVIDQFITGLANYELQKHVQFGHPKSLHEAIGLATEYEALEGSVDRIKKPTIESEKIAPIITQKSDNQQTGSITLEQIGKLIDKKLNSLSVNNRTRSRSPTPARVQSAYKQAKEPKDTTTNNQAGITEKQAPKIEKYCTYCKRNNHMIEECRTRKYHERKRQENSQQNCDAAYVITSQEQPMIVPQIIITSSTDAIENQPERQGDTSNTEIRLPCTEMSEFKTQNRQVLQPIITSQIHEDGCEVTSKMATASCLYLNTDIFQSELKLLLDTGSPYSILSLKCFKNYKLSMTYSLQVM